LTIRNENSPLSLKQRRGAVVSWSGASLEGELIAKRELEGKVLHVITHVITIYNLQHAEEM
jgi:hypothetical protein